ncbi:MAG: hypothetical protein ACRDNJ_09985, partial [Solirubrobacteraceae bacterium]
MTRSLSPRVRGLAALGGAGLVAGLATGRPELVLAAAPLLVLVAVGLAATGPLVLEAAIDVERARLLEGERIAATLTVRNPGTRAVEAQLLVQHSAQLELEPAGAVTVRLAAGQQIEVGFTLRTRRWGAHRIGPVAATARDGLGLGVSELVLASPTVLRAFPREQRLRELVAPMRTQPLLGAHVARGRGEGIEFADVR